MNSRNMKENFNFKIIKVMKSTSKTKLNQLLLSITYNEKYWRSSLDFLHLSIQHNNKGHHENKSNSNNALLLRLGFDPKIMVFSIPEHFFGPLYHACTLLWIAIKPPHFTVKFTMHWWVSSAKARASKRSSYKDCWMKCWTIWFDTLTSTSIAQAWCTWNATQSVASGKIKQRTS